MRLSPLLLAFWMASGCQPNTTRPGFVPLPEAAGTEVRLPVREATRNLAEALRTAALPVRRVAIRDGFIETGWFDAKTGRPRKAARAIGPGVVQVRAWADPARPGSSTLAVETTYRSMVDPSLPGRELERQVPRTHPVAVKVEEVLRKMVERYGGPPAPAAQPPAPAAAQTKEQ